jgi:hypothetical protein
MAVLKNIGSAKKPINFGYGILAFKQDGAWRYRDTEIEGNKFIKATDAELALELEKRGLTVLYPAHECADRPNLPCPACERDALRKWGRRRMACLRVGRRF